MLFILAIALLSLQTIRFCSGSIEYVPHSKLERSGTRFELDASDIDQSCECGKSQVPPSDSRNAAKNEFPWNVYVRVFNGAKQRTRGVSWGRYHDCGGTIINDLFVLTHANCVLKFLPRKDPAKHDTFIPNIKSKEIDSPNVIVYFNLVNKNLRTINDSYHATVEKIYYHPQLPFANYDTAGSNYDIALLKLTNRLQFNSQSGLSPVCLPPTNFPEADFNSFKTKIVGWFASPSNIFETNKDTTKLQKVKSGAIYDMCFGIHNQTKLHPLPTENYFCTSETVKFMDLGSPFIAYTTENIVFQLGMLSWIFPKVKHPLNEVQYQHELDNISPYGLFSKLNSQRQRMFINFHSQKEGARWCKEPANPTLSPFTPGKYYEEPWNSPTSQIPPKLKLNCVCGKLHRQPTAKIVGGVDTSPYEFPIINNRMILTTGRCAAQKFLAPEHHTTDMGLVLRSMDPSSVPIVSHIHYLDKKGLPLNAVTLNLTTVILHPGFFIPTRIVSTFSNDMIYSNNIAILVMRDKLDITDPSWTPICLPEITDDLSFLEVQQALVAGYGGINRTSKQKPTVTQKLTLPVHTNANCQKYISRDFDPDTMLCADYLNASGLYQSDYGGPLMVETAPKEYLQVGVANSPYTPKGSEAAEKLELFGLETISTYARVSAFLKWIEFHAAQLKAEWCNRETTPKFNPQ